MSEIRTPRHRVLNATDLELKITGWRMAQAIRSYPTNPTPLTRQRWNHGLGREIVSVTDIFGAIEYLSEFQWRAVDGIGLAAAAAIGIGRYEVVPASVEYMLVKCNWKGLAVMVDIDQLDHREINDCRDGEDDYSENSLRGECWWLWPDNATKDFNPPSWWAYPTAEVVRTSAIAPTMRIH